MSAAVAAPWADAAHAAALLAVDPVGTGGVGLRALAGPVRDRWLALLRALLPAAAALRRVPLNIADGRLLGGLDLAATLEAGRPVVDRGILAEADGGVVVLVMAERLTAAAAARLTAVLDMGEVVLERDGMARRSPARLGIVALDEGMADDERPPAALLDRLAIHLDLRSITLRDAADQPWSTEVVAAARARLGSVVAGHDVVEALCSAAMVLGVRSVRAPLLALRVARAAAALAGRDEVQDADAALAGRLVLAARATMLPASETPEQQEEAPPEPEPPAPGDDQPADDSADNGGAIEDLVLEAAQAAMPADLLAQLRLAGGVPPRALAPGRAGAVGQAGARGRPAGVRRGEPRGAARLSVVETLRAAAPWQPLRRRAGAVATAGGPPARIEIRRDDFRIKRFKPRTRTTTIFVVDASGSAAFHRLAEAKGAVELLLAECYVRRDRVALLSFRGSTAELLLPPTRSLVRAKRSLAGLPGGGGTPLAAGIDAAAALADTIRRQGETPVVIFLTDGRANIARDGSAGRARADEDSLIAGRRLRLAGLTALLVDTSPRPHPQAARLAGEMGARYLPLPYADAATLSQAVRITAEA